RWRYEGALGRQVILVAIGCAAVYIVFMVVYVVPMYLRRWAPGGAYLSPGTGLRQVLRRCMVEREWAHGRQDAAWVTPYFTAAVCQSMARVHVPTLRNQ